MSVEGLHVERLGSGTPAVFVHGSFGSAASAFAGQRELSDAHELVFVDRRGFGGSAAVKELGWQTDARDVVALLDDRGPAHLVGHSYGGVVALLAAGMRPDAVLSVVAVEPPIFTAAAGDPAADRLSEKTRAVAERAPELDIEDFMREWGASLGQSRFEVQAWTEGFTESDWAAAESSRRERWPGDAPIDFEALAAARFPKVLVHGGWNPEVVGHKAKVGAGFAAVCRSIAERAGGEVVSFPAWSHTPQHEEAAAFNHVLRRVWDSAAPAPAPA